MKRTVPAIVERLLAFVPSDDETESVGNLCEIFDGFSDLPARELALPALFGVLERCSKPELGAPGPIVHELEGIAGYDVGL